MALHGPSCLKVPQTTVVTCGYMHDNLYAAAAIPFTQGSDLSVIPSHDLSSLWISMSVIARRPSDVIPHLARIEVMAKTIN